MHLDTLVNYGLGSVAAEYCYHEQLIKGQRAYLLPYVDIPQHIIAYLIAASLIGKVQAIPFILLPIGFKASLILSEFKYSQERDHLNRLISKITILIGSLILFNTSPNRALTAIRISLIAITACEDLIVLLQHDPSKESFNDYLAVKTLAHHSEA